MPTAVGVHFKFYQAQRAAAALHIEPLGERWPSPHLVSSQSTLRPYTPTDKPEICRLLATERFLTVLLLP